MVAREPGRERAAARVPADDPGAVGCLRHRGQRPLEEIELVARRRRLAERERQDHRSGARLGEVASGAYATGSTRLPG